MKKKSKRKNILIEVQLLFARLQQINKAFVSTSELTKSFGWDTKDVITQHHDVHELQKVLFDALEHSLKHTSQKNLTGSLFYGKTAGNFVTQCCNHSSTTVSQMFNDLYLTLSERCDSVVESLKNEFLDPEIIE